MYGNLLSDSWATLTLLYRYKIVDPWEKNYIKFEQKEWEKQNNALIKKKNLEKKHSYSSNSLSDLKIF